jgi:hypothetical protein
MFPTIQGLPIIIIIDHFHHLIKIIATVLTLLGLSGIMDATILIQLETGQALVLAEYALISTVVLVKI